MWQIDAVASASDIFTQQMVGIFKNCDHQNYSVGRSGEVEYLRLIKQLLETL